MVRCDSCSKAVDTDTDLDCDRGTEILCDACRDPECFECGELISARRVKEGGMCAHCEWLIQI